MKHSLMGLTVLMSAGFAFAENSQAADPVWQTDYQKATAMAKQLKRPLFIVFR